LASWEALNPGWEVRCLDATTVGRYVDLGEHIDLQTQTITAASLSDILRLLLLHEYGGVWADATLYCNRPLDEWLPLAAETGFFAFSRPGPDRPLASWFLAATPDNRLLAKWTARAIAYWRGRDKSEDYFWLHHLFGNLCSTDREARAAWEAGPKISADGPHAIQKVGMYQSADRTRRDIDWTTPVFKLTHRLNKAAYMPGCLADVLLHTRPLAMGAPDRVSADPPRDMARVAGLKVSTENLGDHIQILAAQRLLRRVGLVPECLIDRDDEIATAPGLAGDGQRLGILLNGWFKTNPKEWPPHPRLSPVYIGFHTRLFQAPTLVSPAALAHYTRYGPVGCRDRHTLSVLTSHGVDAFLSHCVSLTVPRRLDDPVHQTETFIVSRNQEILDYLPQPIRSSEFICHYSGTTDFATNLQRATDMLALYRSRARLIVTTLLHCALPAIAMGIPVVVFFPPNRGNPHRSDRERFSSLEEMIRVFHPSEASRVDWRGYTTDVSHIKLALTERTFELVGRWGRLPEVKLGPIAPAAALPVPSEEVVKRHIVDPIRIQEIASAGAPDRLRWGNPSSYKPERDDRAQVAARLMPEGAYLLEIGVGTGVLRELLRHRCTYVGADLEPLDAETRVLDLDSDPLPHDRYDSIIALGVFEYLHRLREAAEKLSAAAGQVVLSYCCARTGSPRGAGVWEQRGWVNHFTEAELVGLFSEVGLIVASRTPLNATDDFEQVVFEFRRAAEV